MNHVNNAAYVTYMDNAAFEIGRQRGWPVERYIREGYGVLVHNTHIEYHQSAVMDEELDVSTWLSDVKRVSAIRHYSIRRAADQSLMVQASSRVAWVNLQTGRPAAIPDYFMDSFRDNVSGYNPDA
jgi:acyl-CoA thioester hydrolase